jgi:hypothetical protein
VDLDLLLLPLSLEYPEPLGFLVHQLLRSDQEYPEYPADLLDLLGQLALGYLEFLVAPAHLFLLYFLSDLLAPDLLLQYFQLLLLLQSHLYFHSVRHPVLSHQLAPLDQEVLQMVQLSLLGLLFPSDLLAPDPLLRLHLYFHSVLVFLVSLVLLVFLVDQLHPVTLGRLEFLEVPQVLSLQLAPVIPVSLVYLVPQSLPLDQSDLGTLAHLEVLSLQFLLVVLSILVLPAVLLVQLHLLPQLVLVSLAHLEVLLGPSPPSDLGTLSVLEDQLGPVDRLDQ